MTEEEQRYRYLLLKSKESSAQPEAAKEPFFKAGPLTIQNDPRKVNWLQAAGEELTKPTPKGAMVADNPLLWLSSPAGEAAAAEGLLKAAPTQEVAAAAKPKIDPFRVRKSAKPPAEAPSSAAKPSEDPWGLRPFASKKPSPLAPAAEAAEIEAPAVSTKKGLLRQEIEHWLMPVSSPVVKKVTGAAIDLGSKAAIKAGKGMINNPGRSVVIPEELIRKLTDE